MAAGYGSNPSRPTTLLLLLGCLLLPSGLSAIFCSFIHFVMLSLSLIIVDGLLNDDC